jgi:hypothetical protein
MRLNPLGIVSIPSLISYTLFRLIDPAWVVFAVEAENPAPGLSAAVSE